MSTSQLLLLEIVCSLAADCVVGVKLCPHCCAGGNAGGGGGGGENGGGAAALTVAAWDDGTFNGGSSVT